MNEPDDIGHLRLGIRWMDVGQGQTILPNLQLIMFLKLDQFIKSE